MRKSMLEIEVVVTKEDGVFYIGVPSRGLCLYTTWVNRYDRKKIKKYAKEIVALDFFSEIEVIPFELKSNQEIIKIKFDIMRELKKVKYLD